MTCNANTLLAQAAQNGYFTDPGLLEIILTQLTCDLAGAVASGSGSSNPPVQYTTDPNTEALTPADPTKTAIAYSADGSGAIYGWNVAQQLWL